MAEQKIIFVNRMRPSSWVWLGFAVVVTFGIVAVEGNDLRLWGGLLLGLAIATVIFVGVVVQFLAKRQVALLSSDGSVLHVEGFAIFGRGSVFDIPIAEIRDWRWTAQSGGKSRFSTLAFTHHGQTYRLPFNGATVLDRAALAELAPVALAEPAARSGR